ncbi:hypothetical protein [Haloimpatiens massiliensis]|uniref:hypothetical protein n=1 Tax=Haloimpatiens massiliensis TaxID=1658110 RepID=UPI000C819593|nr:hypothetical protein [Haloimpatiens massiliensis]
MEKAELRLQFEKALNSIVEKFKSAPKCIAGFLIGSMSHDLIWEWSDLQILLIYDDSYKGCCDYYLLEHNVPVVVNIRKRNSFKTYLESANVSDYFFCALSKSTMLFSKDKILKEYFEDIFYIGDRDREVEMLLGFSEAIYYLNKAQKNFLVKKDSANAAYFMFPLVQGIAWLEVARSRSFPEREIIAQASKLKPELFKKIYEPILNESVTNDMIEKILEECYQYLKDNTMEVYRPIISYLKEHGNLKEFSMKIREHGFGINYDWLYRMGIVDIYAEPIKINNQNIEFFQVGYRIKS